MNSGRKQSNGQERQEEQKGGPGVWSKQKEEEEDRKRAMK